MVAPAKSCSCGIFFASKEQKEEIAELGYRCFHLRPLLGTGPCGCCMAPSSPRTAGEGDEARYVFKYSLHCRSQTPQLSLGSLSILSSDPSKPSHPLTPSGSKGAGSRNPHPLGWAVSL